MSSPDAPSVVIVDDDPSMRQALSRILRLGGYDTLTFVSAEALLQTSAVAQADCLVLDVYLPGLTGLEFYDHLASEGLQPPVIFISAYDEPEDYRNNAARGRASFLAKPFSGHRLVAEVAEAIARSRSG